jgi:hypothetical protein
MKRTTLTKIIMLTVLALLVWAGAGYAKELYQGRGNLEIDPEFNGYRGLHALIIMSDGDLDVQEDASTGDGSLTADVDASAGGAYNSVHEVTVWLNASASVEGSTETVDMTQYHSMQATGYGMYVNNAFSDEELRRRSHIIILTNDYQ